MCMAACLKAKINHFAEEGIHPGDILMTNDGYITGSHLNHVTLTMPYQAQPREGETTS